MAHAGVMNVTRPNNTIKQINHLLRIIMIYPAQNISLPGPPWTKTTFYIIISRNNWARKWWNVMLKDYKNSISEAQEFKKEIDHYRPLTKHQIQELKEYYRIGLTYTSNALEGNSLTETETKIVLEEGITIGGKLP
jgi:hypothetical protein